MSIEKAIFRRTELLIGSEAMSVIAEKRVIYLVSAVSARGVPRVWCAVVCSVLR